MTTFNLDREFSFNASLSRRIIAGRTNKPTDANINQFSIFTSSISAIDLSNFDLTMEAAKYDWSGVSWLNDTDGLGVLTSDCTSGCTLVSETHALANWHCGPNVNDIMHFRGPTGIDYSATVAAATNLGNDIRLVRFTAAPHASLKRYKIINNSGPDLIGKKLWSIKHSGALNLRRVTSVISNEVLHTKDLWGDTNNSASSKPSFIPFTDGDLGLIGTQWHLNGDAWPAPRISQINAVLAGYGESLQTRDLSIGGLLTDFGISLDRISSLLFSRIFDIPFVLNRNLVGPTDIPERGPFNSFKNLGISNIQANSNLSEISSTKNINVISGSSNIVRFGVNR